MKYTNDFDDSKDLVYEGFIAFWQKLDELPTDTQDKAYLFIATSNNSLNYLLDRKSHVNIIDAEKQISPDGKDSIGSKKSAREIGYALVLLPERCREVYELSRFGG